VFVGDAGTNTDAGSTDDAGVDAGLLTAADAGVMEPAPPTGCGCEATTSLSWLLGVGLLLRPRRGKHPG
jgi:hypothetical protein